jgi:mRNA interferase RelE/StbE
VDVIFSPQAARDLDRLDAITGERMRSALRRLANEGEGDVRKMQGEPGSYRLRVGDYRVLFSYGDPSTIRVARVRHRREVYR